MTRFWYLVWLIVGWGLFIFGLTYVPKVEAIVSGSQEAGLSPENIPFLAAFTSLKFALRIIFSLYLVLITTLRLRKAQISRLWILIYAPLIYAGLAMLTYPGKTLGSGFFPSLLAGDISISPAFVAVMMLTLFLLIYMPQKSDIKRRDELSLWPLLSAISGAALSLLYWPRLLSLLDIIPLIGSFLGRTGQFLSQYYRRPMNIIEAYIYVDPAWIMTSVFILSLIMWTYRTKKVS